MCTIWQVKKNAVITLTLPNPFGEARTADDAKPGCRQAAVTQMPKVVDAALG